MDEDNYRNYLDSTDPDLNHYNRYETNFLPYDLDSLRNYLFLDSGFNILHHNARSMLAEGRLDDYSVFLNTINNPFHVFIVLGFTEAWLKPENVACIEFEGFEHAYSLRNCNNDSVYGGGPSFFIKNGINFKI